MFESRWTMPLFVLAVVVVMYALVGLAVLLGAGTNGIENAIVGIALGGVLFGGHADAPRLVRPVSGLDVLTLPGKVVILLLDNGTRLGTPRSPAW